MTWCKVGVSFLKILSIW